MCPLFGGSAVSGLCAETQQDQRLFFLSLEPGSPLAHKIFYARGESLVRGYFFSNACSKIKMGVVIGPMARRYNIKI